MRNPIGICALVQRLWCSPRSGTTAGPGARLGLIVHHTDADREWQYDRSSHVGRLARGLDEAAARGWVIADMKRDWTTIFPPAQ